MSSQGPNQSGGKKVSHSVPGELVRPRYSPGLILEDSDLTAAVDYTRDLNRLLFRSLFGCGVVCGLRVGVEKIDLELKVIVAAGLALDGCGDPIHLVSPTAIRLEARDVFPDSATAEAFPKYRNFWVVLSGGEKPCAPRELVCDADELDILTQPTRIRANAVVSIHFERPKCLCQCKPPPADFGDQGEAAYYKGITKTLLAGQVPDECHEQHAKRIDCASDGGCGAGCECGCGVLLARVHWFDKERAWGPIHRGERRFLRPNFGQDPVQDKAPPAEKAQ